jgi:TRAP-type C4-dicarboxylate transport system permease small subunit
MPERSIIGRIIDGYYRFLRFLATCLMGVIIVPVTLQIFSRYIGFIPRYIWTEELARFCFIWIIIVGATLAVRDGTHFEVDVIPTPPTPRGEAVLKLIVYFFMLVFTYIFVWYGFAYAAFGYVQTSELTGINMVFIFGVYVVAGLTWVVFLAERIWVAIRVLRGDEGAVALLRGDYNVAR